jgi:hypothetical protein
VILILAGVAAAMVAIIVVGFCGYELRWKSQRLRDDLAGLEATLRQLGGVQQGLQDAVTRLSRQSLRP